MLNQDDGTLDAYIAKRVEELRPGFDWKSDDWGGIFGIFFSDYTKDSYSPEEADLIIEDALVYGETIIEEGESGMTKPTYKSPDDPNLWVEIPPAIKVMITKLMNAVDEAAFAGTQPPEAWDELREDVKIRRYNLEATIKTHLKRSSKV